MEPSVGSYRKFSTNEANVGDVSHTFFPLSKSLPMQVTFVAAYFLFAGRIWWVAIQQPQWYVESVRATGVPTWFVLFAIVPPSLVTGPAQIFSNWQLSKSPAFNKFMHLLKNEFTDVEFRDNFPDHQDYYRILGVLLVLFGLIPAVVFWCHSVPHWQWLSFTFALAEGARMFLVQSSTLPLDIATRASSSHADGIIRRIMGDTHNSTWHSTASFVDTHTGDWDTPMYWQDLCEYHRQFNKDMLSLWKVAALPLTFSLLECVVMCADFVLAGLFATNPLISYVCFGMSSVVGLMLLYLLVPMAKATHKCQSLGADMSIRKAADEYVGFKMNNQTLLEYMKFTHYLDRTPTGISMPLIGQVDFALLVSKGILLATAFPAVLTFVRSHIHSAA